MMLVMILAVMHVILTTMFIKNLLPRVRKLEDHDFENRTMDAVMAKAIADINKALIDLKSEKRPDEKKEIPETPKAPIRSITGVVCLEHGDCPWYNNGCSGIVYYNDKVMACMRGTYKLSDFENLCLSHTEDTVDSIIQAVQSSSISYAEARTRLAKLQQNLGPHIM